MVSLVIVLTAGVASRRAFSDQVRLSDQTMELRRLVGEVQSACRLALADVRTDSAAAVKAQLGERAEEAEEAAKLLADTYRQLGMSNDASELTGETGEMVQTVRDAVGGSGLDESRLSRAAEDAITVTELLQRTVEEAEAVTASRARDSSILLAAGLALIAISFMVGLRVATLALSDVLTEALGPVDLSRELGRILADETCQQRVDMLRPCGPEADRREPWRLARLRELHTRDTHTAFEAEVRRADQALLLWGKLYCWAGWLKGFQRIVSPAFGRSTWTALRKMRAWGLPAPLPVSVTVIRRGPITVGLVVLVEHVGATEQVKEFVRARFDGMDAVQRTEFLADLLRFWRCVHRCGLYGLSPRYLHLSRCDDRPVQGPTFYLFDLDKVWVRSSGNSWLNRLLGFRDDRRLLRWLETELSPDEMRFARQELQKASP